MSPETVTFTAYGIPRTQGELKAYRPKGAAFAKVGDAHPEKLRPWREAVRASCLDALHPEWPPWLGPVSIQIVFMLPRPASLPKRRRCWPIGARSGDLDKLTRAILDAITDAGLWRDDAQVVAITCSKDYVAVGGRPGAAVRVSRVGDPTL